MKTTMLPAVFAMLAQVAWCDDMLGQDRYRLAFFENTLASLAQVLNSSPGLVASTPEERESAIFKLAEGFTECHMQAMAAYSREMQRAAYSGIESGGSFPEAKQAFNLAFASEGVAGGDREAAVKAMFENAAVISQECIQQVQGLDLLEGQ